jgi:hypothetical protein
MATFPQLGARRIARDPRGISSYDVSAEGRAIERLGNVVQHDAASRIEAIQAEAERERRQAEHERKVEQKQNADAADRVASITAHGAAENGLIELQRKFNDRILKGEIGRDQVGQEWEAESGQIIGKVIPDLPERLRPELQARLGVLRGKLDRGLNEAFLKRDEHVIGAGLIENREQLQRLAVTDMQTALQRWTMAVDNFGPKANWTPEQMAKAKQDFHEKVSYTQATALVNADPAAAMKALKDQKYLPGLDPQQRTSLIQTADVRVTQAANRAEIAARANERRMEQRWKADATVFEAGKDMNPERAAESLKLYRGTPYEGAFRQLMADGPANASFVGKPLPMQQRLLEEMQGSMNREGATPALVKAYQKAETAHKAAVADIKADPYMAATERGVIRELSPLNLTDLDALPTQLAKRAQDAGQVGQWTGQEVSLFRPAEAVKVAEMLSALPPKDRAGAMSGLAKSMTPGQMRAFGQQLGAKDDTLAAAAILSAQGAQTTAGRQVSEIVMTGADAMKESRIKWPSGQDQTTVRAEIDKLTRGAFLSEAGNRAAGDAALAVYAGLLAEGKSPDAAQAVRLVTGGIMERGGQKLVKPYGWSDGQVDDALSKIGPARIAELTGKQRASIGDRQLTDEELASLLPAAQLGPSGKPGAYTLSIGGRMVMANGRPLVVPLER